MRQYAAAGEADIFSNINGTVCFVICYSAFGIFSLIPAVVIADEQTFALRVDSEVFIEIIPDLSNLCSQIKTFINLLFDFFFRVSEDRIAGTENILKIIIIIIVLLFLKLFPLPPFPSLLFSKSYCLYIFAFGLPLA